VFNILFHHKYMAISGTKGQGCRAISTVVKHRKPHTAKDSYRDCW